MARDDERFAWEEGGKLDEESANRLEEVLRGDPANLDVRLALLGYLCFPKERTDETRARKVAHVVWLIQHVPTSRVLRSPLSSLLTYQNLPVEQAYAAWSTHLEKGDVDPVILLNAASFYTNSFPEKSRAYLERGEALRPEWRTWSYELGNLALRRVTIDREFRAAGSVPARPLLDEAGCQREAQVALAHFERSLLLCKDDAERFSAFSDAVEAAVECGDGGKSVIFADEILRLAPTNTSNRHWRDYVHRAHIARGRAALLRNDLTTAGDELLEAGRIGSEDAPVMRSFGPDFALARELFARGEMTVVLAYLDECERFWNPARIKRWRERLAKGEVPFLHRGFEPTESD